MTRQDTHYVFDNQKLFEERFTPSNTQARHLCTIPLPIPTPQSTSNQGRALQLQHRRDKVHRDCGLQLQQAEDPTDLTIDSKTRLRIAAAAQAGHSARKEGCGLQLQQAGNTGPTPSSSWLQLRMPSATVNQTACMSKSHKGQAVQATSLQP
jgi:hypothetical protein